MQECDAKTTIMIPVDKVEQIGLRSIISLEVADNILAFLYDGKATWNSDAKNRKQSYAVAAKSPDLFMLARMIKELLVQQTKAVLSSFEKELLPKAQKRLFSEIALAKGLGFEDMVHMACLAIQS